MSEKGPGGGPEICEAAGTEQEILTSAADGLEQMKPAVTSERE